jgi:hypothetical protein
MLKGLLSALSILVLFAFSAATAAADPPANDAFAAATPLALGQQISSVNLDATAEPGEPTTGPVISGSCALISESPNCATTVWYTVEAVANEEITVETCDLGTDVDSILAVYSGPAIGALTPIANNDDACAGGYGNHGSRVSFAALAGTQYHVRVGGYRGDMGSFYVRAYAGPPQARPEPDTGIERSNSFAEQIATDGNGFGVLSGPRHSASFPLYSNKADSSFECSLDGAAFAACASPVSYAGLAPGSSHVLQARASSGGATDPTPLIERFTLDTATPETALVSGPQGNTPSQTAEWLVSSSVRNDSGSGFLCGLDGAQYGGCSADFQFEDLCQGPHSFRSAAWSRGANLDPTPVTAQVNVTTGPACTAPTLGEPIVSGTIAATRAGIEFPYESKGAGGTLHLEYGPTSGYGSTERDRPVAPDASGDTGSFLLRYLTPNTTYHYRVTLTTPFGTVSSPDRTLVTPAAEVPLPIVENGSPTVAASAARISGTIDAGGVGAFFGARISAAGPVTAGSPFLEGRPEIPNTAFGAQSIAVQVVDLEPGTTYRYRLSAEQSGPKGNEVLGPEGTFATPAPPKPPVASPLTVTAAKKKTHFRLSKKLVSFGKLTRSSKKLKVKVRGLPAGTVVKLKLNAGKVRLKARKQAGKSGVAKFKSALPRKFRRALGSAKVKAVRLTVIATPPGDTASKVKLKQGLKAPRKR